MRKHIRRENGGVLVSLDDEMETEPVSDISIETEIQKREAKRLLYEVIELLGEPDHQVFLCKYFLFMKNKEKKNPSSDVWEERKRKSGRN